MSDRAGLLVLGWGNRSRGDDALGPMFVDRLRDWAASNGLAASVDFIEEYQLQPEHALDLRDRRHVLFVDASLTCAAPYELQPLVAQRNRSFTSHAMSPQALLQVFEDVQGGQMPECSLLAIRGENFELGAPPCEAASRHLELVLDLGQRWLLEHGGAR